MSRRGVRGAGFTLVEVIVVLVILGLMSATAGLAIASLQAPRESAAVTDLRIARERAILTGAAIPAVGRRAPKAPRAVLFLPDGRALGPGVDPFTGAPR